MHICGNFLSWSKLGTHYGLYREYLIYPDGSNQVCSTSICGIHMLDLYWMSCANHKVVHLPKYMWELFVGQRFGPNMACWGNIWFNLMVLTKFVLHRFVVYIFYVCIGCPAHSTRLYTCPNICWNFWSGPGSHIYKFPHIFCQVYNFVICARHPIKILHVYTTNWCWTNLVRTIRVNQIFPIQAILGPQFGPGQKVPIYMHAGEQAWDWWKVLNAVLWCVYHKLMLIWHGLMHYVWKNMPNTGMFWPHFGIRGKVHPYRWVSAQLCSLSMAKTKMANGVYHKLMLI
jgi:hypothetical protein